MDSTPARIVVELSPGAAPITGYVCASDQESRPFTGWIGLFAALRAAAAAGITAYSIDGREPTSGVKRSLNATEEPTTDDS